VREYRSGYASTASTCAPDLDSPPPSQPQPLQRSCHAYCCLPFAPVSKSACNKGKGRTSVITHITHIGGNTMKRRMIVDVTGLSEERTSKSGGLTRNVSGWVTTSNGDRLWLTGYLTKPTAKEHGPGKTETRYEALFG